MLLRRNLVSTLIASGLIFASPGSNARAETFAVTNLVTSGPLGQPAQITDPSLINPWGMSLSPASPFWVSDNGSGTATLYNVNPVTNVTSKVALTVTIPGAGTVTGQAFNPNSPAAFNGNPFLFVSEDGAVSGWRGALGTSAELLQAADSANVYKGTTLATTGGHSYLYSANFRAGVIDILKGDPGAPALAGTFLDPSLPAGYAPFNIQKLGSSLFVTYAMQDPTKTDELAGAGLGIVDEFDLNGNLIRRVATGGPLNAPWGLALAPASFGSLAGDLLVGNFGDGTINAFDSNGNFLGALLGTDNLPIAIDGLWALMPGNGGSGGNPLGLYFTAGSVNEEQGLFGVLNSETPAVPEPATLSLLAVGLLGLGLARRRRGE